MRKLLDRFRDFRNRGFRRSRRQLPRKVLAPVDEIVEQGILVAEVAVRMTVKNAIIMNALKRQVDYDSAKIEELVAETTVELAEERARDSRHIRRVREEIRNFGRSSWSETEYGIDDSSTLKHREEVYSKLSDLLRARSVNPKFISTTAEQAREAAWLEIGDSLKERASHPYYAGGASEEYQNEREDRIKLFIERDLTALVQQQATAPDAEGNGEGAPKRSIFGRKTKPQPTVER